MINIWIMQIGAGGTGSWFARTLAQMLCQFNDVHKGLLNVNWTIYDYDIIEKRNLLRQPFLAGIGTPKATFLIDTIANLFGINGWDAQHTRLEAKTDMLRGDDLSRDVLQYCGKAPKNQTTLNFVVSCVDNTYTRKILEETIAKSPSDEVYYVNMGVSPDGDWYAERVQGSSLIPTVYSEISYPDAMLSCGQRAETTPVPQTTYSNIMAGAMAAHMVNKLLGDITSDTKVQPILCIEGKDFFTRDISELYLPVHIADVKAAQEAEAKTTTETMEENHEQNAYASDDLAALI